MGGGFAGASTEASRGRRPGGLRYGLMLRAGLLRALAMNFAAGCGEKTALIFLSFTLCSELASRDAIPPDFTFSDRPFVLFDRFRSERRAENLDFF